MQKIECNAKNNPDHKAQLSFLIRREFYLKYYIYRKIPLYLLAITLAAFAFLSFTNSNSFIALKAIVITLISLMWVIAVLLVIPIVYKWINRQAWKQNVLKNGKNNPGVYKISFDYEKIVFESETSRTELNWEYYKYWLENGNSLFIFPKDSLYDAICYSKSDLGEENYNSLKAIVTEKLTKLDK